MKGKQISSGYMGIDDVKFISHGEWADPELEYDGAVANYWDVEDYLIDLAKEEGVNTDDDDEYSKWVIKNADEVRYAVTYFDSSDDEIESGCHGKKKGKKSVKSFARRSIANARLVEGEECVIQVKDKDGKWQDVGYYKDPPYWSFSKGNPKMFNSREEAMKSKLMKAVKDAGYSEEAGNLRLAD